MKDLASWAINTATQRGATYADIRVVNDRSRALATKNGKIGNASDSQSQGMSVRVIVDAAWGFASSAELERLSVEATAERAVEIAKASAQVKQADVSLVPEKAVKGEWTPPFKVDPFSISIEQNLALLMRVDAELRSVKGVTLAEANMNFQREEQWFFSSEGHARGSEYEFPARRTVVLFVGRRGTSSRKLRPAPDTWHMRSRKRNSEAVLSEFLWRPVAEQRIRTDRRASVSRECAAHRGRGRGAALRSSMSREYIRHNFWRPQLGLQIHESVGHPIELDRVLGMEANFAGTSFLTLEKSRAS